MPVCICIITMQRPIAGEFELATKGFNIQYDINYYDINTVLWLIYNIKWSKYFQPLSRANNIISLEVAIL